MSKSEIPFIIILENEGFNVDTNNLTYNARIYPIKKIVSLLIRMTPLLIKQTIPLTIQIAVLIIKMILLITRILNPIQI